MDGRSSARPDRIRSRGVFHRKGSAQDAQKRAVQCQSLPTPAILKASLQLRQTKTVILDSDGQPLDAVHLTSKLDIHPGGIRESGYVFPYAGQAVFQGLFTVSTVVSSLNLSSGFESIFQGLLEPGIILYDQQTDSYKHLL
jgi:hypothetical protein